jgi:hypothetical protein
MASKIASGLILYVTSRYFVEFIRTYLVSKVTNHRIKSILVGDPPKKIGLFLVVVLFVLSHDWNFFEKMLSHRRNLGLNY